MMWNGGNKQTCHDDEDDSWEVRAFEEDTRGNVLGCTWPPRSYTCTFCRKEFRSAQALGGHMNVHRRDRARLHHEAPPLVPATFPKAPSLYIPTANRLCFLYPLPGNSTILVRTPPMDFPTAPPPPFPSAMNKPVDTAANSVVSSICRSTNTEPSASRSTDMGNDDNVRDSAMEELDLELRLGRRSPPAP